MYILTFNLEDWYHRLAHPKTMDMQHWGNFESRIEAYTEKILFFLEEENQKATFFVLGWIAEKYPEVVKKVINAGHEIGVHSYAHELVYLQNREEFREDTKKAIDILEDICGKKMTLYRAPGFSVTESQYWVFEVLAEFGITTDSSIFPASRPHGGFRGFPISKPCILDVHGCKIKEFPVNTCDFYGVRTIYSGGEYFRLFPYSFIKKKTEKSVYIMSYFRFRDFDPEQPRLRGLNPFRYFKSYYGLDGNLKKLRTWVRDFEFVDLQTADLKMPWDIVPIMKV